MARQKIVAGNFKMNGTVDQVTSIMSRLGEADLDPQVQVIIAPTFMHLLLAKSLAKQKVQIAAQDCFYEKSGAFTGQVGLDQLSDANISWTILGHSERRILFNEDNAIVAKKVARAIESGLQVILCVGEALEQRENNRTESFIESQLNSILVLNLDWSKIVIAYEPIWAIGTGKVATPKQAQSTCEFIRQWFQKNATKHADSIRILYGGSVNAKNCRELSACADIDGFLVGGASLKPELVEIININ